jgi:seryl-tRNA synthetase
MPVSGRHNQDLYRRINRKVGLDSEESRHCVDAADFVAGGEAIDFDQVSAGSAERRKFLHTGDPDALREENEQLKQELMQIRKELDRFRVELEARAKTAQIDEEARKLMEENATLRDQVEDAREKMKAVAEQLQQLKQNQRAPKK